jgi:hypothetical protein
MVVIAIEVVIEVIEVIQVVKFLYKRLKWLKK